MAIIKPKIHYNEKGEICCKGCFMLGKQQAEKETAEKVQKLKEIIKHYLNVSDVRETKALYIILDELDNIFGGKTA